jgi:ABC-type multidrug transport system fused ATPase/permease subunit
MSEQDNRIQKPTPQRRQRPMGGPMGGMGMPVQKAKNFKVTLKRLIRYLRPHRTRLLIVLIFAIASTTFTIAAPKVMSKGMNKLQDAYMANMTLKKVAEGQKTAVDQISTSMADAQIKADDSIYEAIAKQVYQGVASGQKAAVDGITKQMGAAQKGLLAQINKQMQQLQQGTPQAAQGTQSGSPQGAAIPQMDAKTIASIQELQKLPLIDTLKTTSEKTDTTIKFINLLQSMPPSMLSSGAQGSQAAGNMDPKTLGPVKQLLEIPMLESITDPNQRVDAIKKFLNVSKNMPASGNQVQSSSMQIDAATMDKALAKIPGIQDFSITSGTGTTKEMSSQEQDAVNELLKLPLLKDIQNTDQKMETLLKLMDTFKKLPDMSQQAGSNTDTAVKINPKDMDTIQEMLKLPMLDTLKDAGQKADVTKQFMDLGNKMKDIMTGSAASPGSDITLTDDQVNGAIRAIRETNGKYDFNFIGMIVLILIGMYLISSLFSLIMGLVMSGVAQNTVRDLRREVDGKLSRLPLKYFDMHPHGDILSRVTNDIDTVSGTLQQSLTQIITSVITIIGYIIMMLTISPVLTLIVLVTMPLYVLTTMFIAKKSQKYFAAQQKELGLLSGHVEEMYSGHKIVKAFGREKVSVDTFEAVNNKLNSAGWKAQFVSGIMFPLMNFISNLGYVGISVVGGIWITRSILGLGDILAFIQYSRSFTMPIVQTANIANIIQSTVACAERVFEVLDEEEELPDGADAVVINNPRGEVRFENVDFRYKEDVPLIENMNMDVKEGHTIAIVGPTGAGKTTLVNLLMRFYELNAGKISVDGVDIKNIKRSELRKMFGMVLQDTWLFNGTIKDNIAYGREDASMDDIIRAAKAAHADRFIRTLPEGYNTVLNEEATNISQGQKQLLTIARAVLADPAILILDEATSSVDTRTEVLIQKAMTSLMKDRTSFVIAHRLSTIRDAELILVMNKGSIIEMGNHKELLAKNGFYADIYNSQFTGANLDNEAV